MAWDTAANIINDAAKDLGLISASIANPYASANRTILQLCNLLKGLGQDLARDRQWTHLQETHTFSTADGTVVYAWPADFLRFIDGTAWNRTNQLRLGGPASPQDWQHLKATSNTGVVYDIFRTVNNEMQLHPTPSAVETIAFEYVSSYWVETEQVAAELDFAGLNGVSAIVVEATTAGAAGNSLSVAAVADAAGAVTISVADGLVTIHFKPDVSTEADIEAAITALSGANDVIGVKTTSSTPASVWAAGDAFAETSLAGGTGTEGVATTETPSVASDKLHFDRRLLVAGLKLAFKDAKGFDMTSAQTAFDAALARASGGDGAAPAISLNRRTGFRLINGANIPDTGYGS